MKGRICLVTGATSGIGEITALELARQGATVVVVSRSAEKCAATVEKIKRETGNPDVEAIPADLSSQASIRKLVEDFKARYPKLNVLVNNAGGVNPTRKETVDGIELTWALNHLGYFLLTNLLRDRLEAGAPARIVNVASEAERMGKINFEDLEAKKKYGAWTTYAQSKLANIIFTKELARRLQGTGVTVNAVHPGYVASQFGMEYSGLAGLAMRVGQIFAISPEAGAKTSIYLASSPEVEGISGKYWTKCKQIEPMPAALDIDIAQKLWKVSEQMTGLDREGGDGSVDPQLSRTRSA